jgi:hypothetical protein
MANRSAGGPALMLQTGVDGLSTQLLLCTAHIETRLPDGLHMNVMLREGIRSAVFCSEVVKVDRNCATSGQ